jgi:hypothetical protein
MKRLTSFSILLLSFLTAPSTLFAQDYIVNTKNDTLKGEFIGSKFKAIGWDKARRIDFSNIKAIYTAKDDNLKRAVFKSKDADPEFMMILEKGKINLYEEHINELVMNGGMVEITQWYVAKGTDTVTLLKTSDYSIGSVFIKSRKGRKNDFAEMIMDNKEIYDKYLSDDKFTFREIRGLIHLYNTGEPYKEPEPKPVTTKVRIGNRQ